MKLTVRSLLVVLLLIASCAITASFADLRVGAFNIQVFGKSKAGDDDVLDVLVKVQFCADVDLTRKYVCRLPYKSMFIHRCKIVFKKEFEKTLYFAKLTT